ncbi:Acyl-CoA synthetase (AMP-forming)/AMP-acid ligase II [Sphingobium faniae]|nr:Acyl-CoA synthetase (AMP-forming)/AMP-acid ligase II [Sphingobium faniae]
MQMRRDVSGFMLRWDAKLAAWADELGDWPNRTVAHYARDRFEANPDRVQIVDEGREISCGELYRGALSLAGYFDAIGLKAGDVVSFQLPNWWEANVINLAAAMIGVVVNPIVPINRDAEVTYMLNASGTRVIFVPELFRKFDYPAMLDRIRGELDHAPEVVVVRGAPDAGHMRFDEILGAASPVSGPRDIDPNALKLLLYTSGTTGRPKGVLHTHNTVHADGMKMVPALGLTASDMTFSPSPITHVSGYLWVLNHPWLKDIPAVTVDVWKAERAFDLIEQYRCAFMLGATPFLQEMVAIAKARGSSLPFLRQYLCGGAAVPASLMYEATRIFENCIAFRNFGASEVMTMTRGPASRDDMKYGAETDGKLYHCKAKIVDIATGEPVASGEEGEILAWEPSMAAGYARTEDNEAAYDDDGYFRMGDIVQLVYEDHVVVTGRKKDLIIRSGENISAKEIEDALSDHPMIADIAVVSMPSKITGEAICAFVVPAGDAVPTIVDLDKAVAAAGLARQKTPEHVVLIEELPRTAAGKVRKDVLREQARTIAQAAVA